MAPIELLLFTWLIVLNDKSTFLGPYLSLSCLWLLWGSICTGNSSTHQVCARAAWPNAAALGQVQPAAGKEIPAAQRLQQGEELQGKRGRNRSVPGRRASPVRSGLPAQDQDMKGLEPGGWRERRRLRNGQVNPSHAGIFQAASQMTAQEDVYNTCLQSPKGY